MLGTEDEIEDRMAAGGLNERWEIWLKKFEDGQLNCSDFRSFWATTVPELYPLLMTTSCLNPNFDNAKIDIVLLSSLEKFVTGAPDPNHVVKTLQSKESPPSFCGHIFKSGEPAYSCRDCGSDPTCVMCALCFKSSEHNQHKYKMNISRGGGYCDCGDQEAWKKGYTCSTHDKETKDDEEIVPQDMQARLRLVVESALIYAFQLLVWNKYMELPTDLDVAKKKNMHATVLFNDESHTYEQVIASLSRAIGVDEREAVEFAATVDREGRAMVKIDGYTECCQVKTSIERTTSRNGARPLVVAVMTCPLISHQMFALRLIQWVDTFCKQLRGFTNIVGNVLLTVPTSPIEIYPLVRSVMRYDAKLWKSARQLWHQLIIDGILMNSVTKLQLAKMFARDYPDLVKDFINDDHTHTMSILNLSVQLFSVISVAHTLIAEDNVISALMRTFLSECMGHKNPGTGKLAFDRAHTGNSFRRCQYVLNDLKFILYVKPNLPWSEELRKSFSSGLENVLVLLSDMQCMDSVVRQVGQHVEFEAEWETGINIQLKLSPVISILLEWCEMDKDVLIRAIRKTLDHLTKADKSCSATDVAYITRKLTGIYDEEVECIDYDVSVQPITVHLPLSRFLSGLLLSTSKFDLDFNSHQLEIQDKPSMIQVMEQPLRLQVMLAQFRAGMWRRNGYSLLNQVFFYTNFRIRAETFDRDIALLQYCAAKLNPNEFLIHVLNKFDLLSWSTNQGFPRSTGEVTPDMSTLGDDFLSLLLYMVAERHEPGIGEVTEVDRVRNEVIQLLCIEPMPHSKLVKQLPAKYDDSAMEFILEKVLGEVAKFERATTVGAVGKYKLKPEYYQYFNPFFYHYSREEQSKVEEVQLKRRKTENLPGFCPPPVLPPFTAEYKPILKILDCNVFGHLVNTILERCIKGSTLHSDAHLERILHLVGIGFDEVQRGCLGPSYVERMQSMKENFESAAAKLGEVGSLGALMNFIIRKIQAPVTGVDEVEPEKMEVDPAPANTKRDRSAQLAAARRAKILAQMNAQQQQFSRGNAHMFEANEEEEKEQEDLPKFICILCREEEIVSPQAKKSLVVSAFVQKSAVLRKSDNTISAGPSGNAAQSAPLLMGLPPSDLSHGTHVSTCGHVMHSECWEAFYELVQVKESRRPNRYGRHVSFDVAQNEFLCPLCECLSNTVIPILPSLRDESVQSTPEMALSDWLDHLRSIAGKAVQMPTFKTGHRSVETLWSPVPMKELEDPHLELPPRSDHMLQRFVSSIESERMGEDDDIILAVTYTLSYTIQATEWCIRSEDKTLLADISSRKLYCLENMIKAIRPSLLLGILSPYEVASDAIKILRRILLPQTEVDFCILEIDPFGLLCLLHFSLPRITDYDPSSLSKNLLSLVTAMHLVQIVISLYLRMDKGDDEMKVSEEPTPPPLIDVDRVNKFASEVLLAAGLSADSRFPPASRVIEALVPFLRATAIFQYFISPKDCDLRMRNNKLKDASSVCHFIGLSSERLNTILECRPLRELALAWARQPKVLHLATSHWRPIYPLKITSLISLPHDYSDIISYVSTVTCPSSNGEVNILADEVRAPSMCLVCGAVLCSQSYCCQTMWNSRRVGACVAHARNCSAGIGVFLRIKDCRVMFLVGATKGKYCSPPYIDEYGETDPGLARGNPLTLCNSAYAQLNQLWLSHAIPEQVAHALETSTNLSSINWALM